jgi:hypothetical protein
MMSLLYLKYAKYMKNSQRFCRADIYEPAIAFPHTALNTGKSNAKPRHRICLIIKISKKRAVSRRRAAPWIIHLMKNYVLGN